MTKKTTAMFCGNCGSTEVSLEAVVTFEPGIGPSVGDICDKGHVCRECGGDVKVYEATSPLTAYFIAAACLDDDASMFVQAYSPAQAVLLWLGHDVATNLFDLDGCGANAMTVRPDHGDLFKVTKGSETTFKLFKLPMPADEDRGAGVLEWQEEIIDLAAA